MFIIPTHSSMGPIWAAPFLFMFTSWQTCICYLFNLYLKIKVNVSFVVIILTDKPEQIWVEHRKWQKRWRILTVSTQYLCVLDLIVPSIMYWICCVHQCVLQCEYSVKEYHADCLFCHFLLLLISCSATPCVCTLFQVTPTVLPVQRAAIRLSCHISIRETWKIL